MIFFTSDTHFGSYDTILRENRPFKNAKSFDKQLIKNFNKQAEKKDIIYHLGDFFNYNSKDKSSWTKTLHIVKKINANVILIIGNNEERIVEQFFQNDFELFKTFLISKGFFGVEKEKFLELNNKKFYLNHYPRNYRANMINLFGHTHRATGLWKPYGLNVGCDLNHFYLFSDVEIERLLEKKAIYWDTDVDNLTM